MGLRPLSSHNKTQWRKIIMSDIAYPRPFVFYDDCNCKQHPVKYPSTTLWRAPGPGVLTNLWSCAGDLPAPGCTCIAPATACTHALVLFGSMEIHTCGFVQPLRRQTRALLAYLVATGQARSRPFLYNLLFSETADPAGALRWHLSQIRRRLGGDALVVEEIWCNSTSSPHGRTVSSSGVYCVVHWPN
jgi:hypothetical protein